MGCGCKKRSERFEVVASGKVVYSTSNEATAQVVARRYEQAEVRKTPKR
jgi:hypothetical protein